ncbi:MAG: hypothetical protein JJT76_03505 [Clostridiaceae bacterium]|nr:hypothetical protein [Clostridiaceae bacterium]
MKKGGLSLKIRREGEDNMMRETFSFSGEKNNKEGSKKKMIYFILESKVTGDIWTNSKDYNDMQSKYNKNGWTYEDVKGSNGRIILETISRSEFEATLKMLKPVPLGFKVEESLKKSLEKIAESKRIGLIDATSEAIKEYIDNNKQLIKE